MARYFHKHSIPLDDWRRQTNYGHRLEAVKALRSQLHLDIRGTVDLMAQVFGFSKATEMWDWQTENQVDLEMVQGPHALTILKAIAAKHGRNKDG